MSSVSQEVGTYNFQKERSQNKTQYKNIVEIAKTYVIIHEWGMK